MYQSLLAKPLDRQTLALKTTLEQTTGWPKGKAHELGLLGKQVLVALGEPERQTGE